MMFFWPIFVSKTKMSSGHIEINFQNAAWRFSCHEYFWKEFTAHHSHMSHNFYMGCSSIQMSFINIAWAGILYKSYVLVFIIYLVHINMFWFHTPSITGCWEFPITVFLGGGHLSQRLLLEKSHYIFRWYRNDIPKLRYSTA